MLLVADDATRCAEVLAALGTSRPVTVLWAAADVWQAIATAPPELIVLSQAVARLRDFEVPRRLRELAPNVPVVILGTEGTLSAADPDR